MKKMLLGIATLVLFAVPVYANNEVYDEPREGVVWRQNVNVRAKPSTKAKIITVINPEPEETRDLVIVHERSEHEDRYWCKIEMEIEDETAPLYGWIASEFVHIVPPRLFKLPNEMWGLVLGTYKSEIPGLVEIKHEKNDYEEDYGTHYVVWKKVKVGYGVEADRIECAFDEKNRLKSARVSIIDHEVEYDIEDNVLLRYVIQMFGETEEGNSEDGTYGEFWWRDEDTDNDLIFSQEGCYDDENDRYISVSTLLFGAPRVGDTPWKTIDLYLVCGNKLR